MYYKLITFSNFISLSSFVQSILFASLFLFCFSCKQTSKEKAPGVFHYNQSNYITSLDPAFAKTQNNIWAIDHLFNQLVDLDDSMQLIPEIASSWFASEDGLQYTFTIRNDIYFHADPCFGNNQSRHLVAQDVEYSFNRLLDPKVNSPGSWIFRDKVDSVRPFFALNDSTFIIQLKSPFSPLLHMLSMQYCSVIPKEAVEHYKNEIGKHPVGTGAFQLKKWIGRRGLFLSRNPNYFKPVVPKLKGIRISFIEDRNTAYLEFLKKEIDFFSGLQSGFALQLVTKDGVLRDDRKDHMQMIKGDYLNTEYIGINFSLLNKEHPLADKRIRQALNFAIDRKTMLRLLKFEIGTPALDGFIPKGLPSYVGNAVQSYDYNPDTARQLLKLAGYDSKPFPELTIYTNKDYIDLITFVAKQWEEIGIRVQIDLMETATLREKMRNSELPLFRASWIADYPDEESFLNVFYSNNPAPPNYTRFKNSTFDSLYQEAIKTTEHSNRMELYKKMNQIIIDEAPVIFLFYDETAWFVQKQISNLKGNPLNLLKLEEVGEDNH
jgi:ABC-type transport system substrate-binding protein